MKKGIIYFISIMLMLIALPGRATVLDETGNAQNLIEQWFSDMKNEHFQRAQMFLAPQFISLHTDGITRDRNQEMLLIRNLHMKSYKLTDFQFTYSGDVVVVTFKDRGEEVIGNRPINAKPAGRMAVLQRQGNRWLLLAYANLDMIG